MYKDLYLKKFFKTGIVIISKKFDNLPQTRCNYISGYRINSKKGIAFRKWATNLIKEYLIKGYNINHDKITQKRLDQLHQTIEFNHYYS